MPMIASGRLVAPTLLLLALPTPAFAYMGPGLGLGAVGTAIGMILALVLGLLSILWYPLKRRYRRLRGRPAAISAVRARRDAE